LNSQRIKRFQRSEQVRYRTGKSVKPGDYYYIKFALVGILHQPVQLGSGILFARDASVYIYAEDFKPSTLAIFLYLASLDIWILAIDG
jgi:hypothetical protein